MLKLADSEIIQTNSKLLLFSDDRTTNVYLLLVVTFLKITKKKKESQILKPYRTSLNQEHVKLTKKIPY